MSSWQQSLVAPVVVRRNTGTITELVPKDGCNPGPRKRAHLARLCAEEGTPEVQKGALYTFMHILATKYVHELGRAEYPDIPTQMRDLGVKAVHIRRGLKSRPITYVCAY